MNKDIAHQLITYVAWLKSGQFLDCGKSITLKRMVSHIEVRTGKKCEEVFEEMENNTKFQQELRQHKKMQKGVTLSGVKFQIEKEVKKYAQDNLRAWFRQMKLAKFDKLTPQQKSKVCCGYELKHKLKVIEHNDKMKEKCKDGIMTFTEYDYEFQKPIRACNGFDFGMDTINRIPFHLTQMIIPPHYDLGEYLVKKWNGTIPKKMLILD